MEGVLPLVSHVLCSLSRLVNIVCPGNVPEGVIPHLCGAPLLPCKKNGCLFPIALRDKAPGLQTCSKFSSA